MERTNIEKYYASMLPIIQMHKEGLLTFDEYLKSEALIAEKYCIKISNIYRAIDLINTPFRAIYMYAKKEVENSGNNQDQSITKIEKKA